MPSNEQAVNTNALLITLIGELNLVTLEEMEQKNIECYGVFEIEEKTYKFDLMEFIRINRELMEAIKKMRADLNELMKKGLNHIHKINTLELEGMELSAGEAGTDRPEAEWVVYPVPEDTTIVLEEGTE